MFWLRLALKEIRVNKGFSLFFILNMAIGLAGFIGVHSFGSSLDRHMAGSLKELLTADLALSLSTEITDEEMALARKILGQDAQMARLISFHTMLSPLNAPASGPGRKKGLPGKRLPARLVQVMAVDGSFPLYGAFSLESGTDPGGIQTRPGLFMTRDTALGLGLRQADAHDLPLRLGEKNFFLADFFQEDPDLTLASVGLAPKIYMGLDQLDGTGLLGYGSRIQYFYFFKVNPGTDVQDLSQQLSQAFYALSPDTPRINVFDTRDVNRQLGRLTKYFTGYMGLVSIVALFLAGMSAAYLFRGVIALKQKQMAILMSMGTHRYKIYTFVSLQLFLLGALASLAAMVLSFGLMPAFPLIFKDLVPPSLVLSIDSTTLVLALAVGMGSSLIFCLPVFVRLFDVAPLSLLRGGSWNPGNGGHPLLLALAFIPGLASFFGVAALVAGNVTQGLIFSAGFLVAMVILSVLGVLVFRLCAALIRTQWAAKQVAVKVALRNLVRNQWSALSCFVTIAMGVFLIALIPQVQRGLETEITRPQGFKLPVFFLVDIQDEQTAALKDFMATQPGDLTHISPMVQGRILSVNGRPFFDTHLKADPKEKRGRRPGRRLEFIFSYRQDLADSETLVKGEPLSAEPWQFGSAEPFGVSVAVSFADRHNLNIGDVIAFSVQGIPLTGQVKNLRKVKWNSFQPNFFLLFQDGVLNDAPKTHLGTISNLDPELRETVKIKMVDAFPNISVLDVSQTAATILSVADRLSLSVRFMAWLAIGAGLVSIFSIARHEARKNRHQINLLKVLGIGFAQLRLIAMIEFGWIGFFASFWAVILSAAFSLGISWYFFDSLWQLDLGYLLSILVMATGVCMATGLLAARQVIHALPLELLAETRG